MKNVFYFKVCKGGSCAADEAVWITVRLIKSTC